jgi:hypothetical protein
MITAPPAPEFVQQPASLWVPDRRGSYGPLIIDMCDDIGIETDPVQRRDIDVLASFGAGGRWLTYEQCIVEGRQNGKTKSVVLPLVMADLFLFDDRAQIDRVVWTSHLMSTSMDTFQRVEELIEQNSWLGRKIREVKKSKTEQQFILKNGSSLAFFARTGGGGRGLGGKRIVFDEALFLTASPLGALVPVLRARPNPQITYASSAGKPESVHLRSLMRRGRRGGDRSLTYIEYRAPGSWRDPGCLADKCQHLFGTPGCSLDNEEWWAQANHAIGQGRMLLDTVRGERATLGHTHENVAEFGRECLGWEQDGDDEQRLVDTAEWERTAVPAGYSPGKRRRPVFYLDVAPFGRAASIGAAADRVDGTGVHLNLAAHRLGADWIVARAAELKDRHPEAIFGGSTTGGIKAYLPALKQAGIDVHIGKGPVIAGSLVLFTEAELAAGCGHLLQLATTSPYRMTHSPDPLFETALAGAAKKDVGDGLWIWIRRGQQLVELSPIYAITGAAWLLETTRPEDYDLSRSVY